MGCKKSSTMTHWLSCSLTVGRKPLLSAVHEFAVYVCSSGTAPLTHDTSVWCVCVCRCSLVMGSGVTPGTEHTCLQEQEAQMCLLSLPWKVSQSLLRGRGGPQALSYAPHGIPRGSIEIGSHLRPMPVSTTELLHRLHPGLPCRSAVAAAHNQQSLFVASPPV